MLGHRHGTISKTPHWNTPSTSNSNSSETSYLGLEPPPTTPRDFTFWGKILHSVQRPQTPEGKKHKISELSYPGHTSKTDQTPHTESGSGLWPYSLEHTISEMSEMPTLGNRLQTLQ